MGDTKPTIETLLERFQDLRVHMDLQFAQINRRFEQIDQRFEQIDQRFEQIDKRFDQMNQKFDHVNQQFAEVNQRLDRIEEEHILTNKKLGRFILDNVHINARVEVLEEQFGAFKNGPDAPTAPIR